MANIRRADLDPLAGLAERLSGGFAGGLKTILNQKVQDMQRAPIRKELEALNVSPEAAAFISRLEPKDQLAAMQLYQGGGGNAQAQGGQGVGSQYGNQFRGQQQGQAQQGNPFAKQRTPAQLKHEDALVSSQQNLQDIITTTQRMMDTLGSGKVSSGVIAGAAGHLAPSWLGKESELFDKDAAHIVNLTSADIKGVPSRFRVQLIEKEKPGLKHSEAVNRQILERLNRDARNKLGTLGQRYPELGNFEEAQQQFPGQEAQIVDRQNQPQQEQFGEESPLGKTARLGVRTASRVGEALLGVPGDIGATVLGVGNWATNGAIPSYGQIQEAIPFLPPTSDDIKQFVGKATGGYTNPRGAVEETIDDVAGTVASLFLPSKLKIPFTKNLEKVFSPKVAARAANVVLPFSGVPIGKALKIAAAGTVAGKATEAIGGGPLAQAGAKLAAMSLATSGTPKQLLTNKMEEAYNLSNDAVKGKISAKNSIAINPTLARIKTFKDKIRRSASPNKDQLLGITNEIENGLKQSKTLATKAGLRNRSSIEDIVNQKKALNEWFGLSTKQRVAGEQFVSPTARRYLGELGDILEQPLAEYGKNNLQFGANRAIANDLYKGLANPPKINDFIKSLGSGFSTSLKSFLVKTLFKQGVIAGAEKASAMQQLFSKSPSAVNYYWDALKAAGEQNATAFFKAAAKLDKEALRVMGR
jgi:hypothetical protein